jgi:hypothetical protein
MLEPAKTVIEICGGVKATAEMAGAHHTWVRRWTYPRHRHDGTGGLIPAKFQAPILAEAKRRGLPLTAEHFFPKGEDAA